MNKKLLVITTCRDREHHLEKFLPHLKQQLSDQNISDYKIVVVKQTPKGPFNQGVLENIGFKKYYKDFDYVCFHDIDILGQNIDYSYSDKPTSLIRYRSKYNYKPQYDGFFGAAVLFPVEDFVTINGYSNLYGGWGSEDDEIKLRCDTFGIETKNRMGRSLELDEDVDVVKRNYDIDHYNDNLKRFQTLKYKCSKSKRILVFKSDGLNNVDERVHVIKESDNELLIEVK